MEDEIQPYAKEAIALLNGAGIETIMLSGDKKERCDELAAKLGIKKVYSEQTPAQKLEIVDQLSQTSKIAMVGDGMNDAPALAKARQTARPIPLPPPVTITALFVKSVMGESSWLVNGILEKVTR